MVGRGSGMSWVKKPYNVGDRQKYGLLLRCLEKKKKWGWKGLRVARRNCLVKRNRIGEDFKDDIGHMIS